MLKSKSSYSTSRKLWSRLFLLITFMLAVTTFVIIGGNEETVKAYQSFNLDGEKFQYGDDEDFPVSQKGYSGVTESSNTFGTFVLEGDCSRNIDTSN